ncbi:MAG: choice-of-anchor D domain-containing protein [Deltaproteobacteria bacterium]|nr:choice-of-anchor D domain-containing protein [Deltaproteobacteria bacterium]
MKRNFVLGALFLVLHLIPITIPAAESDDEFLLRLPSLLASVLSPKIQVTPDKVSFGTVTISTAWERTFVISNAGRRTLTITELAGLPYEGFSLPNPPALPLSLAPDESRNITVRFEPTTKGPKLAELVIKSDDPKQPFATAEFSAVAAFFRPFGFHLNPVLLNGPGALRFEKNVHYLRKPQPDDRYFSYFSPDGTRFVQLPLADGLVKSYPTPEDYQRLKGIGDFVVCNIWKSYWDDPVDGPEMRKVIDGCASNGLLLIIRIEDTSRISNHPTPGPTDESWFVTSFEPYVRSLVQYGKGKVFAYQVWNEAWEPSRYLLGPTGQMISNGEYIDHLARVGSVIRSEDPSVDIFNSAMTSIVESQYNSRTKDLLDMDIEDHINIFNFHYFPHGEVSFGEQLKLLELGFLISKDVIITECNHIDPLVTDSDKFNAIMDVRNEVSEVFELRGVMAFAWNAGTADPTLLIWAIKDTPLEDMLYNEYNP